MMAYNEHLADRIRRELKDQNASFEEKKMFGGICFMVDDKMCVGVIKDDLMARIHPEEVDQLLSRSGARLMDFTKRPMKGYLFIDGDGTDLDDDLSFWVQQCLAYNPLAKSSKKKKAK
jgi:TfoX/Sxy family transcriptional regulator of competence genes